MKDVNAYPGSRWKATVAMGQTAKELFVDGAYHVLLSHRPSLLETYGACGADLVFSGHAHGGQIRLPFVGGLYAPGQGFLPKLTKGLYGVEDTTLVVSRGLGNSTFPFRFLNRPEVVALTLRTEN